MSSKVSIIFAFFIPDEYHYQRACNSLLSLETIKEYIEHVYIGGYTDEKFKEEWNKIISARSFPCTVYFQENKGKSVVINHLVNYCLEKVLYMDCDIILDSTIIKTFSLLVDYDVIIPNQKEDCRHNIYRLEYIQEKVLLDDLNEVYIISDPYGIAGGCFLARKDVLLSTPFHEKGLYGSDDIEWIEECIEKEKKMILTKDIYITHPSYPDSYPHKYTYEFWKLTQALSSYHKKN